MAAGAHTCCPPSLLESMADTEPISDPHVHRQAHVTLCQRCLTAYMTSSLSLEQFKQEFRPRADLARLPTDYP